MKIKSKLLYVFSLSFLLILIGGLHLYFGGSSVSSQEATEQETREIVIKPAGKIRVRRAKIRTPEDMARAEVELRSMPFEELEVPFMPTMDLSEYLRLKEEANSGVATEGATESPAPELELVEPRVAPTLRGVDYNGASQTAADGFPPDTHGAVGTSHFVEAVNRRIIVFDKSNPGVQQCSFALQACFGAAGPVFDPRVVYDPVWNRWVFVVTRRSSSATDTIRRFFLAASQTGNPCGSYFLYQVNFAATLAFDNGDWWDFPALGMNQDAVIVTGNIFDTPTGPAKFAAMVPIAKARIYNGLGFGTLVFPNLLGTLQPPIVLDQNKDAYLIAASA